MACGIVVMNERPADRISANTMLFEQCFPMSNMGPMQLNVGLDDTAGLLPAFSGSVTMLCYANNQTHRLPVVLSVYKTFYEFYAVISQDRAILKDFGYINLKRCCLQTIDDVIVKMIPIGRNAHGQTLTFQMASKADADKIRAIFELTDSDEESLAHIDNPLDVINETGERTSHTSSLNGNQSRPPPKVASRQSRQGKRKTSLPALLEED